MISSSQLRPGEALPSVREVALTHAVNPMTISKAYSLLEAEGLLERQRGKAMTVAAGLSVGQRQKLSMFDGWDATRAAALAAACPEGWEAEPLALEEIFVELHT